MAVGGAVTIVAALSLLTVSALSLLEGDDDRTTTVGLGPELDDAEGSTTPTTRVRRPSTTTSTSEPEVLGEVTTRDPDPTATSTTVAPAPGPASATSRPSPTPPPATTAPPSTAPPTTVCRNSTDPACGTFRWDPEPAPAEVEVQVVSAPPEQAVVGEPLTFTLEYVERAGADAVGACGAWTVRGPGISDATTCEAVAHSCSRYGPHDPPPASAHRVTVTRTVTFDEPGTYRVSAEGFTATHLADGCASPYLGSWDVPASTVTVVDG